MTLTDEQIKKRAKELYPFVNDIQSNVRINEYRSVYLKAVKETKELCERILNVENKLASSWVSVAERLPTEKDADESGKVLIIRPMNNGQIRQAKSIHDWNMVRFCDKDTFWQRLPPSPNIEKSNN